MCEDGGGAAAVRAAAPRPAPGPAVDPIALEPVDEVVVTVLVDNLVDALLAGSDHVRRPPLSAGRVAAADGAVAELPTLSRRAQHALADALPDAHVPSSVGSRYTLAA
jgi:hypothetical protein